MDRDEFFAKLMRLYPESFSKTSIAHERLQQYICALDENKLGYKIDFSELFNCITNEWKFEKTPPPAWLREKSILCKIHTAQAQLRHIWILYPPYANKHNPDGIPVQFSFPANWTDAQILGYFKNKYPNKDGFRILSR